MESINQRPLGPGIMTESEQFILNIIRYGLEGRRDDLCMVARRLARNVRESNPDLYLEIIKLVVPKKQRREILRKASR